MTSPAVPTTPIRPVAGTVPPVAATALRLVGGDAARSARIAAAPPAYLLALPAADVARHAALLTPPPPPASVRVITTPGGRAGLWHLDVAARDRPGLLAACTGVLAEASIDVVQAVVATWDDGAALEAFVVRSPTLPDAALLEGALADALARPQSSPPLPGARVSFDDHASPLFTACEVRADDRPGLLHALAVAFAAVGVDVHAASAATSCQPGRDRAMAVDRFDLADEAGAKLTPRAQAAVTAAIHEGVAAIPPRRGGRRAWRRSRA